MGFCNTYLTSAVERDSGAGFSSSVSDYDLQAAENLRGMAKDIKAVWEKWMKEQDDISAYCSIEDFLCDIGAAAEEIEERYADEQERQERAWE